MEYKYNFFIKMCIESFQEISIVMFLSLSMPSFANFSQIISIFVTCFFALYLIILTYKVGKFLFRNAVKIRITGNKFLWSSWCLYGEFKDNSPLCLLYYPIFFSRRFIYAFTVTALARFPYAQCGIISFSFFVFAIYQITLRPFKQRSTNFIMTVNETLLFLISIIFFRLIVPLDHIEKKIIGYILIGIILVLCVGNLFAIWTQKIF